MIQTFHYAPVGLPLKLEGTIWIKKGGEGWLLPFKYKMYRSASVPPHISQTAGVWSSWKCTRWLPFTVKLKLLYHIIDTCNYIYKSDCILITGCLPFIEWRYTRDSLIVLYIRQWYVILCFSPKTELQNKPKIHVLEHIYDFIFSLWWVTLLCIPYESG